MIIVCINCNKKFNVESELIPESGRNIQCGSCNHIWHFKIEKQNFHDNINSQQKSTSVENPIKSSNDLVKIEVAELGNDRVTEKVNKPKKNIIEENIAKDKKNNNFLSFLLVFIISFIALIILLDTLKSPIIDIFTGLELILFNLFETLKDVKLFIIDLT